MKFLLDCANLEAVAFFNEFYPIAGVTTNPSILKKNQGIDFFPQLIKIQRILAGRDLHVQTTAKESDQIIQEAHCLVNKLGKDIYVKVPVFEEGMKAIKTLKKEGIRITATAVYTKFQAYMALELGADTIAPYFNRMENLGISSIDVITDLRYIIDRDGYESQILGASFKNTYQVSDALKAGAHQVTLSEDVMKETFLNPSIEKAISDFADDWVDFAGGTESICELKG
uniref:fructose-6-phosphate aldolase n=1 Tax=Ndongobacter massiliensis TaxID=1871025 RepID=UPI000931CD4A|nr:fructose-6-phosphate aldolase [Ndongobacter massiliensis]